MNYFLFGATKYKNFLYNPKLRNDCEMTHFFYSMRTVDKDTSDKNR